MDLATLRQYMRDLENWEQAKSPAEGMPPDPSPKLVEARPEPAPESSVIHSKGDEHNHSEKEEEIPPSSRVENARGEPAAVYN